MIIRIELNQLENRSGYYFFNDFLFTGLAYDHRDNQLIDNNHIVSITWYACIRHEHINEKTGDYND